MNRVPYLDAAAVSSALTPLEAVEAIVAALSGGFDPASDIPRIAADTSTGQFLLMPSEVGAQAGVKVVTVAPENSARGLPRIQATYLLYDAATLSLRAILDGTALTSLRTPAVSIAAVRPALALVTGPLRVVVFGAGPQAVGHAMTIRAVSANPLGRLTFLVRSTSSAGAARSIGHVVTADSRAGRIALAEAHLIVCATTARTPLFPPDAVRSDAIVIAVGSHEPDARELDGRLLGSASVIVEDIDTALREAGDVILAHRDGLLDTGALLPLKDVVTGAASLQRDRPVVFKGVGMSWQDLIIARAVLARSEDQDGGRGTTDTPVVSPADR
ncbi:MAG: Ornithine cyclodeaminase/mu-crystallin [Naasia sp.]|uniref:ornithine cyclodeaminase family protein n=1 Tax=Naasia sp. TaxID=2546198 RepID=UPI002634C8A9|nr:ornithine cyclodeaminase family protein [Naasia sp.]MCU1569938.1 Ornithine cyclodeaminase/mu-crystallin [Naasia sp.]